MQSELFLQRGLLLRLLACLTFIQLYLLKCSLVSLVGRIFLQANTAAITLGSFKETNNIRITSSYYR